MKPNKTLYWVLWIPIALPFMLISLVCLPFWYLDKWTYKLEIKIKDKLLEFTKYHENGHN